MWCQRITSLISFSLLPTPLWPCMVLPPGSGVGVYGGTYPKSHNYYNRGASDASLLYSRVSTWFANARRRLKKENKVTWSPRACKSSDERGCDEDSSEAEKPLRSSTHLHTQRCAELQSDLEDFDMVESDASDSDPKSHVLPEDEEANPNGQRLSADCSKLTPVNHQNSSFYMNQDLRSPDTKPKIWSIAHTAVPPEAGSQPEYPPCMLSSTRSSSPVYPTNMALTSVDRQQESPVATLREWVDGVFHGPPFQQSKPAEVWKDLNEAMIDSGTSAQPFELIQSTPCL
ncbi:hypothetical protein GOODEAATRI_016931 [Goodea atripinnis]|uniref:Uncharacterized protein n=1 Tax=Goodea atripinnis TaxID=208336 RepID=A0ABV0NWJ7_9TELE